MIDRTATSIPEVVGYFMRRNYINWGVFDELRLNCILQLSLLLQQLPALT